MSTTPSTNIPLSITTDDLARAHAIAARARCDVRTALRAIQRGPDAIRPRLVREAVTAAMRALDAEG